MNDNKIATPMQEKSASHFPWNMAWKGILHAARAESSGRKP
jgi:hypothetical protein